MPTRSSFQLSVGGLVSKTLAVYFRNLLPFLLLSAIVLSPWIALRLYRGNVVEPNVGLNLAELLLSTLLTYVLTGAVTYGVVQQLRGEPAGLGQAISQGMRTFLTVLGTGILCGVRIMLFSLLLWVPGIIESIKLYVAIPAAVMEGKGAARAIERSNALTDGSRWQIFGAWLLMFTLPIALTVALVFVLHTVSGPTGLHPVAEIGISMVFNAFSATMMAVCYFLLRSGKENVDVKELAAVFA